MIKLNSSFGRSFFSTIRFPQKYKRTFQLNNRIKSKYCLKDLGALVEAEKEEIDKYGKTILLEYFCEFPLNHVYNQVDSPLKVFLHCNELKDLTLYQAQMKYSCLKKISLILSRPSENLQNQLRRQQTNLFKRSNQFDAIDAINLFIHLKGGDKHNLLEVCLQKVCNSPPEILSSMLSRIISMFFKKIASFSGQKLRKFKKLINFLCDEFELSLEIWRLMGTIFQEVVSMKLHMLGHNRFPKIIGQISAKCVENIDKIDIYWLQYVFKGYEKLPFNYNNQHLQIMYNQILKRLKRKEKFFMDNIPFKRLPKSKIEQIILILSENKQQLNPIYFINTLDRFYLFQSPKLVEIILTQFLKPISKHQFTDAHFSCVVSTAWMLLEHFNEQPSIKMKIQAQLKKHFLVITTIGNQIMKWMRCLSITNLATLMSLQKGYNILPNFNDQIQRSLSFRATFFNKRNTISSNQINRNVNSLQQLLLLHASSPIPSIQSFIIKIIKSAISKTYDVNEDQFSLFIFYLEKTNNSKAYNSVLAALYGKIAMSKESKENLIDSYIRFSAKTTRLNTNFVIRVWKEFRDVNLILRIIAGAQIQYFQQIDRLNQNILHTIQNMTPLLTENSFTNLNSSQIIKILQFFQYFTYQTIAFSKQLILIVASLLKQNKISNEYQQICQTPTILIEILKLYHMTKGQTSSPTMQNLIAKVDQQLFISNINRDNKLTTIQHIENRIFLKNIFSYNSKQIDHQINQILSIITQKSQLRNKGKLSLILLKLHSFSQLNLEEDKLCTLQNVVKQSLSKGLMFSNDIQYILGRQLQSFSLKADKSKLSPLVKILQYSLNQIEQLQPTSYYIFALRIAHNIRNTDLIKKILTIITNVILECNEVLKILKIVVFYPQIQSDYFLKYIITLMNYKKIDSQQLFYSQTSYYINVVYDQIPEQYRTAFQKIYENAEDYLVRDARRIKQQKIDTQDKINRFLIRCFKYYWVAIKNNLVNDKTLQVYQVSKKYAKYYGKYQDSQVLDGINPQLLPVFNQILSSKISINPQIPIPLQQVKQPKIIPKFNQPKKPFFKPKTTVKIQSKIQSNKKIEGQILPSIKYQDNRQYNLESALKSKKIPIFDTKNQSKNFYVYGEIHRQLKTHYRIVINGKQIYVHNLRKQLSSNDRHQRGQINLWRQIYKQIVGKDVHFIQDNSNDFKFL